MRDALRKTEWAVALLITCLAICLHYIFFQHAGGLWRDEAGTVQLAARSTFSDLWGHLFYDSFPAFWVLITRIWLFLGFGSDGGLRFLGFLVGLFGLASIWFCARCLRISVPFFSLLLLGFSSTIIIWGDSMRAWGWGLAWLIITFGLVWRVVELPGRLNVAAACVAAIASVHSTYYNWVMLFAICAAGALVSVCEGNWKRGGLVLGIGVLAAISVVPYVIGILHLKGHYLASQSPFNWSNFAAKLVFAISEGAAPSKYVWGLVVLGALATGIYCHFKPAVVNATASQRKLLMFAVMALGIGFLSYFMFLKVLRFGTQPWYYSALMALTAVSVDSVLSVLANSKRARLIRLAFVSVAALVSVIPLCKTVAMRMTNTDLIAKNLEQSAGKDDLILVNPWYCGVSFQFYYKGHTEWTTLPALQDHTFHDYESLVQVMMNPDQMQAIQNVLGRIKATLVAGKRVWLVGGLMYPPPGQNPPTLPAAPNGPEGWASTPYQELWSLEAGYFVQAHLEHYKEFIMSPENGHVNPAEFLPFAVVEGWHDK